MDDVVVIKLNIARQETWRYTGRVISSQPNEIFIEAFFNRDDLPFHGIIFGRGDRFLEKYYSDRWYNIFEIRDRLDDHLKGWYCNVTCPAEFHDDQILYVDLALDLLVYPDGRQLVLDEDEFALLTIDDTVRKQARAALADLQAFFQHPQNFQQSNSL